MTTSRLTVLGSINVDHIMNIAQFPAPGETVIGKQYQTAFGGKGANQAVACGRSGADITFIACVGDDAIGAEILAQLQRDRIHTAAVSVVPEAATGVAMIFVNEDGENVIGISAGANAALTPEHFAPYKGLVEQSDALLMQLESPLETVIAAAQAAKNHQTRVILNPAPARELPDSLLKLVDVITPNETEAEKLTGISVSDETGAARAAKVLHDKGIGQVLITLGSRGVWLSVNGEGRRIPGFKVNAVDTIAAGDTFNGAYVTALLEGKPADEAVRFAHAAAAIAVTRRGAQPSVPWRREIDAFLAERG
ncbi:ribokinase [Morganella morganii]|uniref:ribokinase n=1 Tax=Morganella morganii TaxID=582 RepID=UPI0012998DA6|nr:ribokinase [Morganella morganii]MBT0422704.1 ribokinase [Morganella morganii subsp. morganii]MBT0517302.1 ribokinase [Morganella morganii subsp. morganii]MRE60301.1 ribokinase [Morganella morganii]QWM04246.1 ribokinase [Morganella morganii subsp. morganii]HBL6966443.1 ribokinase [Morganella morganii]